MSVVLTPSMIQLFSGEDDPRKVVPRPSELALGATLRTDWKDRPVGTFFAKVSALITAPEEVEPWSMTGAVALTTTSLAFRALGTSWRVTRMVLSRSTVMPPRWPGR